MILNVKNTLCILFLLLTTFIQASFDEGAFLKQFGEKYKIPALIGDAGVLTAWTLLAYKFLTVSNQYDNTRAKSLLKGLGYISTAPLASAALSLLAITTYHSPNIESLLFQLHFIGAPMRLMVTYPVSYSLYLYTKLKNWLFNKKE